jgi:hypothetical protein
MGSEFRGIQVVVVVVVEYCTNEILYGMRCKEVENPAGVYSVSRAGDDKCVLELDWNRE